MRGFHSAFERRARRRGRAPTNRDRSAFLPQLDMQVNTCLLFMQVNDCMNQPDLLFKALADSSRRKLLDLLYANDGQTLGQLCEHLNMTRQSVTQHLDLLEAANLVATRRRGREKLHFLNPVPLQDIYERWIAKFEKPRLKALHDLKRHLESEEP
jgi:DNA-binding transcriptional ArsR family regulator